MTEEHPTASQPLSGLGIAITRPLEQGEQLGKQISAQGGIPYLFPLLAISPLEDYRLFEQQLQQLSQYDWAIFISSNAVQNAVLHLKKAWPALPPHLYFAAIGPATALELQKAFAVDVLTPSNRYDSESLLALPELQAMLGKRVMIFRGVGGREVLAETLKARGAAVDFAECYRRVNPQSDVEPLAALWQNKALHAIVVTSSEAMRHLLKMTDDGKAQWLSELVICVNHARIAELPSERGLKVAIANAPGDEAMLQCLRQLPQNLAS